MTKTHNSKLTTQNSLFNSQTYGQLNLADVVDKLAQFCRAEPDFDYRLIIGSDSQGKNGACDFVSTIIVHRVGQGGIYFWLKRNGIVTYSLRDRIWKEATFSLELAEDLLEELEKKNLLEDLQIHVDIGRVGETRELIAEVVGYIRGNGFDVKIKPEAYGAAKVADRHV